MRANRIVVAGALWVAAAFGQPQASQGGDRRLSVRLFVSDANVCSSSLVVSAEVELGNLGAGSSAIDAARIGNLSGVALYSMQKNAARAEATTRAGRVVKPERLAVTLPPGARQWVSVQLVLDKEFFSESGFYSVSLTYTTAGDESELIESNSAIIEVDVCGKSVGEQRSNATKRKDRI